MGNENLHAAKRAKNDEFYTRYADIEAECRHYAPYFRDKVVFCPCDDAVWSQFAAYFARNFQVLGLRRLICSCFYEPQGDLFAAFDPKKRGYWTCYDGQMPADKWLNNPQRNYFKQAHGGDFRSPEVTALLKESDFVVTNPPFSLFREFYSWILENGKDYLIIGNFQSVKYKCVFENIKDGKTFLGATGIFSLICKDSENNEKPPVPCSWFSNYKIELPPKKILKLTKSYYADPSKYPKYDNYDAINVDRLADIPFDYADKMGVPITILWYLERGGVEVDFEVLNHSSFVNKTNTKWLTNFKRDTFTATLTLREKGGGYVHPELGYECRGVYERVFIQKKSALTVEFEVLGSDLSPDVKSVAIETLNPNIKKPRFFNSRMTLYIENPNFYYAKADGTRLQPTFNRIIIRRRAVPCRLNLSRI